MKPLVILHGVFGSSKNWRGISKPLSKNFDVVALDLPGHGETPAPSTLTYPLMVDFVLNQMQALKLDQAAIMGHSMGGKVAMLLACRHPQRVEKLVVLDIAPKTYPGLEKELHAMKSLDLSKVQSRGDALTMMEKMIPSLKLREFLLMNLIRLENNRFAWKIDLEVLRRSLPHFPMNPLTEKDRFLGPTHFIFSQSSGYVLPEDETIIRHHFPNAQLTPLPHVGHNIHIDDPGELVKLLKS